MSRFTIHLKKDDDPTVFINRAAEIVKEGGIIAFPTDTVYGMGSDPFNIEVVKQIFTVVAPGILCFTMVFTKDKVKK